MQKALGAFWLSPHDLPILRPHLSMNNFTHKWNILPICVRALCFYARYPRLVFTRTCYNSFVVFSNIGEITLVTMELEFL